MDHYSPPQKKIKTSENIDAKLTHLDHSFMEFKCMESRKSKSPAIAKNSRLSYLRKLCDLCMKPPSVDDDEISYGAAITYLNADKRDYMRDYAKSALEFYNCTNSTNFKLVKVCKANFGGMHFALTFRAQEDGSEECLLFRGAVQLVIGGGRKTVFCEIKGNDEVTLLPDDDDYVSSGQSHDSEDSSLFTRKKDSGDGCPANSGDGSTGGSEEGSLK